LAQKHNVGTIVVATDAYIADQLVLKYFTAPILNAIRSKIKNMRTISSKHFKIEYWVQILEQMFSMNNSARRENSIVTVIDTVFSTDFQFISQYMITDYGITDTEIIYKILHSNSRQAIIDAIQIARQNNVYNIQYVNAILERTKALAGIEHQKVERLAIKAESSSSILDKQKVQHSAIDMAMAQYNWQKMQEDAELERRFNEIMK
jgi:hypothetical protein